MKLERPHYAAAETNLLANLPEIQLRTQAYESYFDTLAPKTDGEVFKRGLFAFASVHTSWKMNVILYKALEPYETWINDDASLLSVLVSTRAGLHNNRAKFIGAYGRLFWQDPTFFRPRKDETYTAYRNRIESAVQGLGMAKAAFFNELVTFQKSDCVCVDTHMMQTYGLPPGAGSLTRQGYEDLEQHWANICRLAGVRPVTARWVLWDLKQNNQPDSRYWSYVLEKEPCPTTSPPLPSQSPSPAT